MRFWTFQYLSVRRNINQNWINLWLIKEESPYKPEIFLDKGN